MIMLVPTVQPSQDGKRTETQSWHILRDGKMIGYCWNRGTPQVALTKRNALSQSEIYELSVRLGGTPTIKQPPRITPRDLQDFERRIRRR